MLLNSFDRPKGSMEIDYITAYITAMEIKEEIEAEGCYTLRVYPGTLSDLVRLCVFFNKLKGCIDGGDRQSYNHDHDPSRITDVQAARL